MPLGLRHAADPGGMIHHPLALGDGELAEEEEALARRGGDPVGIAAAGVQERGLRGPRRLLGQLDQLVLDLERAQSFEFAQGEDVGHAQLLVSMVACTRAWHSDLSASGQQHDDHHSPDRQQRVADRVGDGVAEPGNLALGAIVDHAERGCRRARAGAASQHNGVVET